MSSTKTQTTLYYEPLLYQASAGTGKTFTLTNRYLSLLIHGERPERILATTFTRKAAAEIKQRIIERLSKAALSEANCNELARQLEVDNLSLSQVRNVLSNLVKNLHRLEISTLDSFIVKLCRSSTHELGLPKEWAILEQDPELARQISLKALALILECFSSEDLGLLASAIEPGKASNKIASKFLKLFFELVDLYSDSDATAWEHPINLVASWKDSIAETYINRLLKLEIPITKSTKTFNKSWQDNVIKLNTLIAKGDFFEILKNGLVQKVSNQETSFGKAPISDDWQDFLQDLINVTANQVRVILSEQIRAVSLLLGHYLKNSNKIKDEVAVYSYADLKRLFSKQLNLNLEQLYYRIDSNIKHILLDEFQDTSLKEWYSLEPLVAEILSKTSDQNTFFCVGDTKQAIYGWRGGVAEIFDLLKETWPQLKIENLNTSYRSSPAVIDFVNTIFSNLNELKAFSGYKEVAYKWDRSFNQHVSIKSEHLGYIAIKEISKTDKHDDKPSISNFEEELSKLLEAPSNLNIAILYRKNSSVAEAIQYLRLKYPNVSISDEGSNALSKSLGVNLIFSLLELIDYPANSYAWFHLKNSKFARSLCIADNSNEINYIELKKLQLELVQNGMGKFISRLVEIVKPEVESNEINQLEQLEELAYRYPYTKIIRPMQFVLWAKSQKIESSQTAQIRVMTIHQSKGLEFDAVFIPELKEPFYKYSQFVDCIYDQRQLKANKIYKHISVKLHSALPEYKEASKNETEKQISEALCVFYVAITRAKYALYLGLSEKESSSVLTAEKFIKEKLELLDSVSDYSYEVGDNYWYEKIEKRKVVDQRVVSLPDKILITKKSVVPRGLHYLSVTKLAKSKYSFIEEQGLQKSNNRFHKGILVHKAIEDIIWIDCSDFDYDNFVKKNIESNSLKADDFNFLKDLEINKYWKESYYRDLGLKEIKVFNEKTILYYKDGQIVNGKIDRYVQALNNDGSLYIEVVDFKTDQFELLAPEAKNDRILQYHNQLNIYAQFLAKHYQVLEGEIKKSLVFLY